MKKQDCSIKSSEWKLEIIEIPDPCTVPWESMSGTDTVRFCDQCEKNVYNISSMSEAEARNLLISSEGTVCISMLKRADGTVVSDSCPRVLRPVRDGFKRIAAAVATLLAISISCLPVRANDDSNKDNSKPCPAQPQRLGGAPRAMPPAEKSTEVVPSLDKELLKLAKITQKQAEATAVKEAPSAKMQACELERENGKLVYSFDFEDKAGVKEVQVDAITGKLVSVKIETAADEAKEKAAEAKEKAAAAKAKSPASKAPQNTAAKAADQSNQKKK